MGFLSRVLGGRQDDEPQSSSQASSSSLISDHDVHSASQSHLNVPKVPDAALPESVEGLFKPQETTRMYNPYAGLQTIDPRLQQQRQFRISTQPEFVFQEEASHKRRSVSENLGYYTGAGYLGGAIVGGCVGLAQGVMFRPEIASSSRRLMVNRLLNTTGQQGRLAGNTLGVLGLMFAMSESTSWYLLDTYAPYSPSWYGTVAAGALAGGVYRTPRGPKAAAITAGVGAITAMTLLGLRQVFPGL